jgi:hypothetical protein
VIVMDRGYQSQTVPIDRIAFKYRVVKRPSGAGTVIGFIDSDIIAWSLALISDRRAGQMHRIASGKYVPGYVDWSCRFERGKDETGVDRSPCFQALRFAFRVQMQAMGDGTQRQLAMGRRFRMFRHIIKDVRRHYETNTAFGVVLMRTLIVMRKHGYLQIKILTW